MGDGDKRICKWDELRAWQWAVDAEDGGETTMRCAFRCSTGRADVVELRYIPACACRAELFLEEAMSFGFKYSFARKIPYLD